MSTSSNTAHGEASRGLHYCSAGSKWTDISTRELPGGATADAGISSTAVNAQAQESRIHVLLLVEQGLFRASLGRLLASEPELEVVGECGLRAEALEALGKSHVDVVLQEFVSGRKQDVDFISAAQSAGYHGHFLILTGSADVRNSAMAFNAGASGVFLKTEAPDRLVQAIKLVANGGVWVDQTVLQSLVDQVSQRTQSADRETPGPLEEKERRVLLGILGGLTNRKIAEDIGISESAVKNVVQRLFTKTGARNRSQLVRVAIDSSMGTAGALRDQQPHKRGTPGPLSLEVTQQSGRTPPVANNT